MEDGRLAAWMALLDSGLSAGVLNRLLQIFGAPEDVLGAKNQDWVDLADLRIEQCQRLRDSENDQARRARQLDIFAEHGMRLIEFHSPEYPERLREIHNAPPALFIKGELTRDDFFSLAIVGSRMATPYGIEVTRRLATEFAPLMTVVSGLAHGIDSIAHEAALRAGGRTIGVAACSLDQDYPKGTAPLREKIVEQGAIVSAYPPLTKAATHHFPARNVLMAGMVLAVIVAEASEASGALLTAQAAIEASREVFAVPGDITRRNSRGSNGLIAQGAGLATCAADVLAALGDQINRELAARREAENDVGEKPTAVTVDVGSLPPAQSMIFEAIHHTQRQFDDLLAEFVPARMSMGELTSALLQLELKGIVKQLPGKVFVPAAVVP